MRFSESLRSDDVRTVLSLSGEIRSMDNPAARARRQAEALSGVLHARVACVGEVPRDLVRVRVPWVPYAEHGWLDSEQRRTLFASLDNPRARDQSLITMLSERAVCLTRGRREVLDDDGWYRSEYVAQYRLESGLDDQAISISSELTRPGWVGVIGLHRDKSDRPFSDAELTLLDVLHTEVAPWLWRNGLSPSSAPAQRSGVKNSGGPDLSVLTPAQRKLVPYLLQGLSEQAIADKLCRSRHTIHDHVLAIYKQLEVGGRVELVLKFGRQNPNDGD